MNAANNESPKRGIPAADCVDLLMARIDLDKRKDEATKEFVAANDRQQKRRFEFHTTRREREMALRHARHKTLRTLVYGLVPATVLTVWFLFYNAFYGDGLRQEYALAIIKYLAIGLAGYGVISGIAGLFKRLLKPSEE